MGKAGKMCICLSSPCSLLQTVQMGRGNVEEICLSDCYCISKANFHVGYRGLIGCPNFQEYDEGFAMLLIRSFTAAR